MRVLYATLLDVRRELEVSDDDTSVPADDRWIVESALPHVSARIEQLTSKEYAPRRRTRRFNAYGDHIDDLKRALWLIGNPLLEVETLTIGDTEVEAEHYQFLEDDTPYYFLSLRRAAPVYWDSFEDDWLNSIALAGVYGYRRNYPEEGWQGSGQTVLDAPLSSSATTVTVANHAVFSPGHLLQIEAEWLLVSETTLVENEDPTPDVHTLTVQRGVRGSTAVAHDATTPISIWEPQPQIRRAASRWAAFLYQRRASFEIKKRDGMTGTVIEELPADAPQEVQNILKEFFDWSFQSGE